jgi:hypothetical protein
MRRLCPAVLLCLLLTPLALRAGPSQVGGRVSPDGAEELACDLPGAEHLKNTGGRGRGGPGTGAGLCVFTSIEHSGRWQNVEELRGFQEKMTHEEGGGWPEKVDRMLARYAPGAAYAQYTGTDPDVVRLALRTGRMPAVTYGYSPRYGGRVAHMVNLVHLSDKWACVLDNNFPGEDRYEWMSPAEFLYRWKLGDTKGWAVFLLAPPPPPVPVNGDPGPPRGRRVIGGWGAGGCGPVGPVSPPRIPAAPVLPFTPPALIPPAPAYEWRFFPDDDTQAALFQGGVQVGGYDFERGRYRPLVNGAWGPERAAPPVPPPAPPASDLARRRARAGRDCPCPPGCSCPADPCGCAGRGGEAPDRGAVPNFGVAADRIPGGEEYHLNGRRADARAVRQALARGGSLSDDTGKWRLTVTGTAEECRRVADDLKGHPALAAWRDRLLVQTYRPDAWAVTGVGLPAGGHPSIVLEDSPGPGNRARVLHRQDDYDGGAEALAGALRKADPSYDPRKDPDLRRPAPPALPSPADVPGWGCALLGAVLVLLLRGAAPRLGAALASARARLRRPPPPPALDNALLERLLKILEAPREPAPPR